MPKIQPYAKKNTPENRALAKFQKNHGYLHPRKVKFTPEEIELYILLYLKDATDPKKQVVASQAGFVTWLMRKGMWLSQSQLKRYEKLDEYKDAISAIKLAQRGQLERASIFSFVGMAQPITLMLKNVGYVDKHINENVQAPTFEFEKGKISEPEIIENERE
jgi:hypothetical protein